MRLWGVTADGLVVLPASCSAAAGLRSPSIDFKIPPTISAPLNKSCTYAGWRKVGIRLKNHRASNFKVRALESSGEGQSAVAPLQFESPSGQLLAQIMQTHPHLLPAAIDQQLETMKLDQDAQKEDTPPSPQDLLQRRIAEIKDKERQRTLEEIMYCSIVQKFMENKISMIPPLSPPTGQVDSWPNQEHKLEAVHSSDAWEMIQSHLTLVIGERATGPLSTVVQISKLKIGKLYAASIMYGYFLKRVDERYQLERTMKTLPKGTKGPRVLEDLNPSPLWDMESMVQISSSPDDSIEEGPYRLRSYVMYLDAETLQRYATIRSKESISLIEMQTQALFGRPDIRIADDGTLDAVNDQVVEISFTGLTMLVLEAVAFGSFLWEAESYVESKYRFLTN